MRSHLDVERRWRTTQIGCADAWRSDLRSGVTGVIVVAIFLVWAVHNGGFDPDTWYWGALAMLAVLIVTLIAYPLPRLGGASILGLATFALYVGWSFASISWAQDPGAALQGSNRALLYLLVFAVMTVLPWTPRAAIAVIVFFALGIGVIAIVLLARLGSGHQVSRLFIQGRLAAPTGYINSTAALFTVGALVAIATSAQRELPGPLRGALAAFACADLQLALTVQSRGWLFTLPVVVVAVTSVVTHRLRVAVTAALAAGGALVTIRRLLAVYGSGGTHGLQKAAMSAGGPALLACAGVFFVATLLAWGDLLRGSWRLPPPLRRTIAVSVIAAAVILAVSAGLLVSRGHPITFVSRQWQGFSAPPTFSKRSHFIDLGSSRYDFWRVALKGFLAHPIGGLGQDNFADYYVIHRRSGEEPQWTHSLELRLLTHTGLVGFAVFAVFIAAALAAALGSRRRGPSLTRTASGVALLPLTVWLIHGSVDWFWEMPALTGPALGFLGMAGALSTAPSPAPAPTGITARRPRARALLAVPTVVLFLAATGVLTLPYLSVHEVSMATDLAKSDPSAALRDLKVAADLNPLDADPGTRAGLLALSIGENAVARTRFAQSIKREPGAWLPWLGTALAASALGERQSAAQALRRAYAINNRQPPIKIALQRVFTAHPLTYAQAVPLFAIAP
jgi:hypothetical protein